MMIAANPHVGIQGVVEVELRSYQVHGCNLDNYTKVFEVRFLLHTMDEVHDFDYENMLLGPMNK